MAKTLLELIVGDIHEKKSYYRFMKRVNALPTEYRYAFKKIQNYIYTLGPENCDMSIFKELIDLFESSVYENKTVLEVVGNDVACFCDELILVSVTNTKSLREKLNEEIQTYFANENPSLQDS